MRKIYRFLAVMLLVFSGWWAAPTSKVNAASLDTTADLVFGQMDFSSNITSLSSHGLSLPTDITWDGQGDLFVADGGNNRVLEYTPPFTNDMDASTVFGQPDFSHANFNSVTAASLYNPHGLVVDASGDLFVGDFGNNRVLEYIPPFTNGMAASKVFGQSGSFTANSPNKGGSANEDSLYFPAGIALDPQGNLYVADFGNNRVLEYDTPLTMDTTADRVFGQPDFTSSAVNNGSASASSTSLNNPIGLVLDAQGNLYVDDWVNNRVLEYAPPFTTNGMAASMVFGQPDFTSSAVNNGNPQPNAKSLSGPTGVALDAKGDLYVVDYNNNRVLEYNPPLIIGEAANMVFGQNGDFTTNSHGIFGVITANNLYQPGGVTLDSQGNLYVTDVFHNRVLEFDLPKLLVYSLSGHITLNGTGLGTVSVGNSSGPTAITASDGSYTISGLLPGSYTLTPSKSGYKFTPPNMVVTLGPDLPNLDFTAASNLITVNLPLLAKNFGPFFLGKSEVEPNNNIDQANGLLIYNQVYTGHHDDTDDFFSFKVDSNSTSISIIFNSTYLEATSHFQIQLIHLLNGQPSVIDSRAVPSTIMKESLDSGIYFIRIFTDPANLNGVKSYTLEVMSP